MRKLLAAKPFLKRWSGNRFFLALHRLAGGDDAVASLAQVLLNLSYRRKTVVSGAQARIACTLRLIGLLDPRARIIVFGERIEQADALYEQLAQLYPNQAARYHSEVDKEARRLALERYRHGEIRILVSCRALDEGFDVPSANVGIILSSSAVERQRIQRLGRILRRCEGKELASLYYLYVAESVEETAYFVDLPAGTGVCDLSFDTQSGAFLHPSYEAAANAVLAALKRKGAAPALLTEAERCISLGVVRPD